MAGKVYLIGAGPGDYKLLTLKALECLKKADVIVYDRLANNEYLKEAKADCEYIDAGKASSNHTLPQDDINAVIAQKAKEGKVVARLKGGDPYVFGRGGEEGEYLYDLGIDFEVIPGITSAIGGLCYAGIPITHRDFASSFHVITGHLKDETKDDTNWAALAKVRGTLVFLMGVANLEKITRHLMQEGKDKETPVALISWATRYNQSVVTGTLETIYKKALEEGVKPPTLIVVGEVVSLREKLNFFENKPLFGKRVVITRTRSQNSILAERIREEGGLALEFPTIEIQQIKENKLLQKAIEHIKAYSYLVFTSGHAIEGFFEALYAQGLDTRVLAHLRIAAIGTATAKLLLAKGIVADLVPEKAVAEALGQLLAENLRPEDHVLLPQSAIARDALKVHLEKICPVDEVAVYQTVKPDYTKDETSRQVVEWLEEGEIDYVTFTSSSTVNNLLEILGDEGIRLLEKTKLISIGEVTSSTLRSYGLRVHQEAAYPTMEAMMHCMLEEK